MRYELQNLGPGNFYFVEVARLLRPGESVTTNKLDEGTRRLAEGPKPRLQIVDLQEAASTAAVTPKLESSPSTLSSSKGKDSPKPTRGTAQDTAPRPTGETKGDAGMTDPIK